MTMFSPASASDSSRHPSSRPKYWLKRVGDIRVLKVSGSHYEMARQHGELLKDDVASGPIPYFRTFVERTLRRAGLGPATRLFWPALEKTVGKRVAQALPDFALESIRGLADGSGVPYSILLGGSTMPDSLMWVVARLNEYGGHGPAVAHRMALGLGCTSAIAWGTGTADGKMYHARNLDYHGVKSWPSSKAVIFHEPDDGYRFVSVAAAGITMGGVTAMNEAGVTLTVHQHMFTDRTALGGIPIGVVGDIVMRKASNADEALAILEQYRPIACWTYLVGDSKRKEVLCFEENPERRAAFRYGPEHGVFGYANIYLDPQLGASEVNLYGSYWRHNHGRHRRANELLAHQKGNHNALSVAHVIGDPGDPRCRIRDSIAMVMTVGSVVFCPDDQMVWVGTGEAPTSRSVYEPFSLTTEDHHPKTIRLAVGTDEPKPSAEAFEWYRRAYVAYTEDGQPQIAQNCLQKACEQMPNQALYHFLYGLLSLKMGEWAAAHTAFGQAITLGHPDPERVAAFYLWRGRCRDVMGQRDDALLDYRAALGHYADPPVHRAARKGLKRAYTGRAAKSVHPDMGLADVITP